jgi:hypothetical protein
MMLLFHLVLLLLNGVKYLFGCRTRALERKYARLAKDVAGVVRELPNKEGNSSRYDPFQAAKRQYVLGALVEKKDRLEEKHHRWALRVERMSRWVQNLRNWKGRLVPYALGAVDILTTMCTLDYFSHGDFVVLRHLVDLVTAKFSA